MTADIPNTINFESFRARLAKSGDHLPSPEFSRDHPHELAIVIGYLLRDQRHPAGWQHLLTASVALLHSSYPVLCQMSAELRAGAEAGSLDALDELLEIHAMATDVSTALACLQSCTERMLTLLNTAPDERPESLVSERFAASLGFTPSELLEKYTIETNSHDDHS